MKRIHSATIDRGSSAPEPTRPWYTDRDTEPLHRIPGNTLYLYRLSDGRVLARGIFRSGLERMQERFTAIGCRCRIVHSTSRQTHWRIEETYFEFRERAKALRSQPA